MKRVIIESPFSGEVERNRAYAVACLYDALRRGEAPFASHLIYTQCLNDEVHSERELGIKAGLEWARLADLTAVYTDRGISAGMKLGIQHAHDNRRPVEIRTLGGHW